MIGTIVGNYKIIQALGEGGVGMVYKGVDTMLDREVAIKVLRPELSSQTSVVERFRSEAVTLAKLSHPNIATLYSLFRHGNDLFMVLEFLKGETLDHTLYRRGKIPTDEAIPIFCQALEGINYAHKLGVVHRDIKPGNMMVTEDGIVKVLDFGIARLLGSARMTRVGNVIGTLEYMSPEQVKGHETDSRSDVYGLGIMLYEMLTGRLPFESPNDFALMKMQIEDTPIAPRDLNPDISQEIEEAIMRAVAKEPQYRFQTAGEFLEFFIEMGFSLQTGTYGFSTFLSRKTSRPSKPGIQSGEVRSDVTLPIVNNQAEVTLQLAQSQTDATFESGKTNDDTIPSITDVQNSSTLVLPNQTASNTEKLPQSQIPTQVMISKPEIPLATELAGETKKEKINETRIAPAQNEIKGTRLATPVVTPPNELKATRLGTVQNEEQNPPAEITVPSSFFSKLNWVHYTGAGVVGLFLLTLVTTAAVLPFVWNRGEKEMPKSVEQNQPSNPSPPQSQPVVKDETTKDSGRSDSGTNPVSQPNSPILSNSNSIPIGTATPSEPKGTVSQTTPKQPKENETARTNQPPAVKQQPKQPAPSRSSSSGAKPAESSESSGSKQEAREVMTKPRKADN